MQVNTVRRIRQTHMLYASTSLFFLRPKSPCLFVVNWKASTTAIATTVLAYLNVSDMALLYYACYCVEHWYNVFLCQQTAPESDTCNNKHACKGRRLLFVCNQHYASAVSPAESGLACVSGLVYVCSVSGIVCSVNNCKKAFESVRKQRLQASSRQIFAT